jgi:hypothetical protein
MEDHTPAIFWPLAQNPDTSTVLLSLGAQRRHGADGESSARGNHAGRACKVDPAAEPQIDIVAARSLDASQPLSSCQFTPDTEREVAAEPMPCRPVSIAPFRLGSRTPSIEDSEP